MSIEDQQTAPDRDAPSVNDPFTLVGGLPLLFVCVACLYALWASIAEMTRGDFENAPVAFALLETLFAISSAWAWVVRYHRWRQAKSRGAEPSRA